MSGWSFRVVDTNRKSDQGVQMWYRLSVGLKYTVLGICITRELLITWGGHMLREDLDGAIIYMPGCYCVSCEYGCLGINQHAAPGMSCVSHIVTQGA